MRRDVAIRWTADGDCPVCKGCGLLRALDIPALPLLLNMPCPCVRAEPGGQPAYLAALIRVPSQILN